MSYDIYFWDGAATPAPATLADAVSGLRALADQPRPAGSRLPAFAALVEAQFTAPTQEASLRRQFEGFARAVAQGGAILAVELPADDRLPVFRFLVETALAQGLAVFDEQIGLLFLPDGRVLPEEGAGAWSDIKRELDKAGESELPRTLAGLKKRCEADLSALLLPLGFQKENQPNSDFPAFMRAGKPGIYQRVSADFRGSYPYYNVSIYFAVRCEGAVEKLSRAGFSKVLDTLFFRLSAVSGRSEEVVSSESYGALLGAIKEYALPLLEEGKTVVGLDRLLNTDFNVKVRDSIRRNLAMPNCLAVAWLARRSDLELLIAELDEAALVIWDTSSRKIEHARKRNMEFLEMWERLKQDIRTTSPTSD